MARREYIDINKTKKMFYIFVFILSMTILISLVLFSIYSRNIRNNSRKNLESLGLTNSAIVDNNDIELTSFSEDKSVATANNKVNDSINAVSNKSTNKNVVDSKVVNKTNTVKNEVTNKVKSENSVNQKNEVSSENKVQEQKFQVPVEGEIIKDFADESLLYSNTLEEWTTHPGIDIKATKTTVVKSAESGTVEAIKNDPRYGLSIVIKHENGFKSIYSNLLTTEFVSEGETVEKGQTLGTVGNTASFEISDDDHLHFEMYKDGKCVNPTIYLK